MAGAAHNLVTWKRAKMRGGLVELPTRPGQLGSFFFIPFLFNPHEFSEKDSQGWEKKKIPLWADPALNYSGGDGVDFKFQMTLELERLKEFRSAGFQQTDENLAAQGLSFTAQSFLFPDNLQDYIDRIELLKFPKRGGEAGNFFQNSPPRVMVIMGKFFRVGVINSTDIKYTEFMTDGSIRSASIEVNMLLSYGRTGNNRFDTLRTVGQVVG